MSTMVPVQNQPGITTFPRHPKSNALQAATTRQPLAEIPLDDQHIPMHSSERKRHNPQTSLSRPAPLPPRRARRPSDSEKFLAAQSGDTPTSSLKRKRTALDVDTSPSEDEYEPAKDKLSGTPPKASPSAKKTKSDQSQRSPNFTLSAPAKVPVYKPRTSTAKEPSSSAGPLVNQRLADDIATWRATEGTYMVRDTPCSHSSPGDWKDVDWKAPGALENTLDESCLALKLLNMAIYKPLNLVLCKEHKHLLSASSFRSHVAHDHSRSLPTVSDKFDHLIQALRDTFPNESRKCLYLVRHVEQAFHIPETHEPHSQVELPFNSTVPFLNRLTIYWTCPNCGHAFLARDDPAAVRQYRVHFNRMPDCQKKAAAILKVVIRKPTITKADIPKFYVTQRYGHEGFPPGTGRRTFILLYPATFTPSGHVYAVRTVAPMPKSTAVIEQGYIKSLQWDRAFVKYIEQEAGQKKLEEGWEKKSKYTAKVLHQLINWTPVPDLLDQEALDRGLSEVWDFLYDYVFTANAWLKTCSDILRKRLTEGTKSQYRDLKPSSMLTYRSALYDPISLLMWTRNAAEHKKPIVLHVADFFHLNKNATMAINALYDFLKEDKDLPRGKLAQLVHKLLVVLLVSQTATDHIVGGPFDIALILSAYVPSSETYGPATVPNRYCAWLQYDMRSIVVHVVRLGDFSKIYTLYEPVTHTPTTCPPPPKSDSLFLIGPITEGSSSAEEAGHPKDPLDLREEDIDLITSGEDEVSDSEIYGEETWMSEESVANFKNPFALDDGNVINADKQSSEIEIGDEVKGDDLLKVLNMCIKWISNEPPTATSQPTAFQRIKEFWVLIWQEAVRCISSVRVESCPMGLIFFYSEARFKEPIELSLSGLKDTVFALMSESRELLHCLLPFEMETKNFQIAISDIKDHPKRIESVFEQNSDVFNALTEMVYEALMKDHEKKFQITAKQKEGRNIAAKNEGIQEWLDKEEELLECLLCTFCLTCGIPARSFQIADFRYTSSADAKRNLYVLKSTVVIGWPRSKSFNRTIQAAVWALPPALGEMLLLYLGVIRRMSLTLTCEIGRIPAKQANTHFFVTAPSVAGEKRVNQPVWTGSQINRVLKGRLASSPVKAGLTPSMMRQVFTAIFKKHFSQMINPSDQRSFMKCVTSIVNRQGDHTQLTCNGNYGIGNGEFDLTDADIDEFFAVSWSLQALLGVAPGTMGIMEQLRKLPHLLEIENQKIAMERARILIMTKYQVQGKKQAESLISRRPFMPKAGLERLGDEVLVEVLAFLQFGHGIPGSLDIMIPDGYPTDQVAEACVLIKLALMEHMEGMLHRYDPTLPSVRASMEEIKRLALTQLERVRGEEKDKWRELSMTAFKFKLNRAREGVEGPDMMKYMDVD